MKYDYPVSDSVHRYELREFHRYELRSQLREWRVRITGSGFLFLAFSVVFLNAEMIRAASIMGFITAFVLHLFAWKAHYKVGKELAHGDS